VVLSTGGAIAERARSQKIPVIAPVTVPVPRAAFASLCAEALVVGERAGIISSVDIEETAALLDAHVDELARQGASLAGSLNGLLPVVWGQDGLLSVAASRWRAQFNENSKVPSYAAVLPELVHNDVVGYDPGVPALEQTAIIVLRSSSESPRMRARIEATLTEVRAARIEQVRAPQGSPIAELAALAMLGDFTSVSLALLRGLDPAAMDPILRIKARLR